MTRLQTLTAGTILASAALAGGSASAAKICFAFQDLETEFWVAGYWRSPPRCRSRAHRHRAQRQRGRQPIARAGARLHRPGRRRHHPDPSGRRERNDHHRRSAGRRHSDRDLQPPALGPLERHRRRRGQQGDRQPAVNHIVEKALAAAPADEKLNAIIVVGDLGDPNAVGRKDGFYASIEKHKDRFKVTEVASQWDAATALSNLEAAVTANPQVDLLFTSSDFLWPTIRSVFEPRGLWKKTGEDGHVWMAGLDGGATACQLIKEGYVDATGVQDLYFEADQSLQGDPRRHRRRRGPARTASSRTRASP